MPDDARTTLAKLHQVKTYAAELLDDTQMVYLGIIACFQDDKFNYPTSSLPAADSLDRVARDQLVAHLRRTADQIEQDVIGGQ
jgi:hypothetical protein